MENDFDGVFRFTNNSDEDFTVLWNNREYTFPAKTRSPLIIPNETMENIQSIRKKFAYKWAEKEWFKSDRYKELSAMEHYRGGRDDKELEPLIQMCLDPLPISQAKVEEKPRKTVNAKASKPVGKSANLNEEFKDAPVESLGVQSNVFEK